MERVVATGEKNVGSIELQYKIIESLQMRHESMKSCKKSIVLMERSLLSSLKVFTKNNSSAFPHPEWEKVESLTRKLISEYEQNDVYRQTVSDMVKLNNIIQKKQRNIISTFKKEDGSNTDPGEETLFLSLAFPSALTLGT